MEFFFVNWIRIILLKLFGLLTHSYGLVHLLRAIHFGLVQVGVTTHSRGALYVAHILWGVSSTTLKFAYLRALIWLWWSFVLVSIRVFFEEILNFFTKILPSFIIYLVLKVLAFVDFGPHIIIALARSFRFIPMLFDMLVRVKPLRFCLALIFELTRNRMIFVGFLIHKFNIT